jgi:uncharacterized protein (TIGR02145 family)
MNCYKCKAEWTPPAGRTITNCPFCGEALIVATLAGKDAALHEVLHGIVQQFGREILGQARLIGLLADFKPDTERKYLTILRQTVNDGVGSKLLELEKNQNSGSMLQINVLKENLKNNHGFSSTADYVVDSFLFALGWTNELPKVEQNLVQVNNLSILEQTVKMAFSDGKLTKEEAKSIFTMAESLSIAEKDAIGLIVQNLKKNQFKADKPFDISKSTIKDILISRDWIPKAPVTVDEKYEAVKIGDQVWMKRNLDVSHFRNGDPIPEAKTNEEWKKAGEEGKPAWCYFKNDPEKGKVYGKLYNWFAVNDPRGLAPEGWHVPNDEDWEILINYLGGKEAAYCKMKSKTGWKNYGIGATGKVTNESGYSAMPGGMRDNEGFFDILHIEGNDYDSYWWLKTDVSNTRARARSIKSHSQYVYSDKYCKGHGFSVRLLKTISTLIDKPIADEKIVDSLIVTNKHTFDSENYYQKRSSSESFEKVKIGEQIWMKKNLDVNHFRNGDPIQEVKSYQEWEKATKEKIPAWCYYENDPEKGKVYGKLYNWYAVVDPRGLAPEGWHIPTYGEWEVLLKYLGSDKGIKLKHTNGWIEGGGNNESGFSGLPGNCRYEDGEFNERNNMYFWSCTEGSSYFAWCLASIFIHWYGSVFEHNTSLRYRYEKGSGLSVRCLSGNKVQVKTSNFTKKATLYSQSYKSKKIGDLEWMTKNLDVSHFQNGDSIFEAKNSGAWKRACKEGRPAWCYYDFAPENGEKYGKLYNFAAVTDPSGLAPKGWYIPSEDNWFDLICFLDDNINTNMKSKTGWLGKNNGSNASGFEGLPGGYCSESGIFYSKGSEGYWWSNTETISGSVIFIKLVADDKSDLPLEQGAVSDHGFSVRCFR